MSIQKILSCIILLSIGGLTVLIFSRTPDQHRDKATLIRNPSLASQASHLPDTPPEQLSSVKIEDSRGAELLTSHQSSSFQEPATNKKQGALQPLITIEGGRLSVRFNPSLTVDGTWKYM
jgi:hypothetical protein